MIDSISAEEFKERLETGDYIVIDIRSPEEIQNGKIDDSAKEFDFFSPNFKLMLETLPRGKKYLIYCGSGGRSKQALKLMEALNFEDVYELSPGISGYHFFS